MIRSTILWILVLSWIGILITLVLTILDAKGVL